MGKNILVINPGSTSTKVGFFRDLNPAATTSISHSREELSDFSSVWDQLKYREKKVRDFLESGAEDWDKLHAVVGRGGLLRPVQGGVYRVNDEMLTDAENGYQGEHPSNLGCALAATFAKEYNADAFIVDPVSTNEMREVARYSGHPAIQRKSLSHSLNLHYVVRKIAKEIEKPLEDTRFIAIHMGGGISVAAIHGGKMIDVNDAINEGPFSTTRSGSLPVLSLAEFITSSNLTYREARGELLKNSGLFGYLDEYDGKNLAEKIQKGDVKVRDVVSAMAYQVAKETWAMSTVLQGNVDNIIITGGLANFEFLVEKIRDGVDWITDVKLLPGEFELEALAEGACRVLTGRETVKNYPVL